MLVTCLAVAVCCRVVVLRCLREVCADGQLLVDLFVNYDCDLDSSNLFERMVNGLVKMAQAALPVNAPVMVTGDVVTMGDITVEAVLAGIAPGQDAHATERAAMQGLWQGDDPGFEVTVRGSTWSES